jgi:hypothetical protein
VAIVNEAQREQAAHFQGWLAALEEQLEDARADTERADAPVEESARHARERGTSGANECDARRVLELADPPTRALSSTRRARARTR